MPMNRLWLLCIVLNLFTVLESLKTVAVFGCGSKTGIYVLQKLRTLEENKVLSPIGIVSGGEKELKKLKKKVGEEFLELSRHRLELADFSDLDNSINSIKKKTIHKALCFYGSKAKRSIFPNLLAAQKQRKESALDNVNIHEMSNLIELCQQKSVETMVFCCCQVCC